jgi:hypothetical protein
MERKQGNYSKLPVFVHCFVCARIYSSLISKDTGSPLFSLVATVA